jgi:hypothetical protein
VVVERQEKYHHRGDDLDQKKDTRVIRGVIIVEIHLPDVPYRVSKQPHSIGNRRR